MSSFDNNARVAQCHRASNSAAIADFLAIYFPVVGEKDSGTRRYNSLLLLLLLLHHRCCCRCIALSATRNEAVPDCSIPNPLHHTTKESTPSPWSVNQLVIRCLPSACSRVVVEKGCSLGHQSNAAAATKSEQISAICSL